MDGSAWQPRVLMPELMVIGANSDGDMRCIYGMHQGTGETDRRRSQEGCAINNLLLTVFDI